mmetsp:Transcript_11854/g.10244  ORF Transcript_11854/g.10244 Transcript_11854/m.10244 type:complete len:132 (+) Transcript_11854:148-543(+)
MGGESIKKEKDKLRKGLNILIATPGRLLYHLQKTTSLSLANLKYIVFEESDRTLDMGFKRELEDIIAIINKQTDFDKIQKMLISASYTEKIESLWLKISRTESKYIGFSKNEEDENEMIYDEEFKIPTTLA